MPDTDQPAAADGTPAALPEGARIVAGDRAALAVAIAWAADEGWRPGLDDEAAFASVDPSGLMSVRLDGEVVTTLTAPRYDDGFGFLGLYITDPRYRGRGFGSALFSAGLDRLRGVTCVGLDGVVERESLYASLGFAKAHLSQRWVTTDGSPLAASGDSIDARPLGAARLGEYERRAAAFPAPREAFLAELLAQPQMHARAVVDAAGEVIGYGAVRRCVGGARIGPLFADDPATAGVLLDDLIARAAHWGPVSIDVPDPNQTGVAMAQARAMTPQFACVRMYAGPDPGLALPRVYGLTSFEFG